MKTKKLDASALRSAPLALALSDRRSSSVSMPFGSCPCISSPLTSSHTAGPFGSGLPVAGRYPATPLLWAGPTPRAPSGRSSLFSGCPSVSLPGRARGLPSSCFCIRRRTVVSDPGQDGDGSPCRRPHCCFPVNEHCQPCRYWSVSRLNPFTCVTVQRLPSCGFSRFVASPSAHSVTGCWLGFPCVGL